MGYFSYILPCKCHRMTMWKAKDGYKVDEALCGPYMHIYIHVSQCSVSVAVLQLTLQPSAPLKPRIVQIESAVSESRSPKTMKCYWLTGESERNIVNSDWYVPVDCQKHAHYSMYAPEIIQFGFVSPSLCFVSKKTNATEANSLDFHYYWSPEQEKYSGVYREQYYGIFRLKYTGNNPKYDN